MALTNNLMNLGNIASPWARLALLGAGTFAGTRPGQTSQTTTTTLPAGYSGLGDLLRQRAMDRINNATDLGGYTAAGISNINDAFSAANLSREASLTSRGLGTSPIAAASDTKFQTARAGNIADFLNTIPLLQQQQQDQALQLGNSIFAQAPRTQTTNATMANGGLSGGIQSAEEMLGYLQGKGALGGGTGTTGGIGGLLGGLFGSGGAGIAAPTAASIIGGSAGAALPSLAAIQAGAVPEIASSAIGLGSLPSAPGILGTGGGVGASSGLASSLGAFFTNPITIGVGAALAGALIWKHSQVHPTADKFVQEYQNPFGQHLGQIVDAFDKAYATGQMTKAQAQTAYQQTASLIQQFTQDLNNFAAKGGKEKIVADQARQTMASWAGPNWENVLGKMQREIAGLRG